MDSQTPGSGAFFPVAGMALTFEYLSKGGIDFGALFKSGAKPTLLFIF